MSSIVRLARYLKPYRRIVSLAVLMLGISAASDLAIPRLAQTVIDQGIGQRDMALIVRVSLVMLGLTLVSAGLAVGNALLAVRVSQNAAADLRRDLFAHIQRLSFANLDRFTTGQLMIRLTSDVMAVLQLTMMTLRMFIRGPLMFLGSVILLLLTNLQLALVIFVFIPLALVVLTVFAVRARPMFLQVQRKLDQLNNVLQENLAGVRVVKAFVREQHENERFDHANVELMDQGIRVGRLLSVLMPLLTFFINLGIVAILWVGGTEVVRGTLTVGQIVAFNNYLMSTMFPLINLGMMVGFISSADASAQRIFEVLDDVPAVQEAPQARELGGIRGRVALENVTFGYDGDTQEPVLRGVELIAEPGQTVAILGSTGAGKSTIVGLIPRFYDATEGRVTVDSADVREVTLASLRAQVGVVAQDAVLFSGTVRENIAYGRPDAREEQVVAAARAAQAHDFVVGFPDGYDTLIGERGVNLSGGQKQRLAIARALLIAPRVLILDDSTSSVDLETEARIQQALTEVAGDSTRFIVAQRLSSVMDADRIIVLERGRIAASGTHRELLATSPIYRDIYRSQLGDDEGGDGDGAEA
jgi:ATP-binding cassette subfamily B protein